MLVTTSAKLTGTPDSSGWSQVHEFLPEEPEKIKLRGHLYAVIATKRVEGTEVDILTSGRELIARLHEEYFGNLEEKPFNALKGAVEKVTKEFKETWGEVEIVACAFVDGVVLTAAAGGGRVVICRDGALATILTSEENVIAASGFPKSGDEILLATKPFFDKVPMGVMKAALTGGSPSVGVETLAPIVHGSENLGSLGVILIKFDEEKLFTESVETQNEEPQTFEVETVKPIAVPFTTKIESFIDRLSRKIPQKSIYIKPGLTDEVISQSKKLTFSVGVILLFVLVISIGFGIRQKGINDKRKEYQGILQEAQSEVDEAINLASVSPDRSRELFILSEQKLQQILDLKVKDPKVLELKKKIDSSKASVLGEYDASPELFLDLSLLSSGFKGDALSTSGGNLFILDKNGKRIVSVNLSTKKSKVVAGPGIIDEAQDLASYQDSSYILMNDGVYEIDNGKSKVIDKTWSGDALIKAFAGNLYVLDKASGAIYRYPGQGSTFGDQQNWLSGSTTADFSNVRQWVIDGSVYTLYPNSKVLKYSLGSPQNFSVTGVSPEIGSIDAIFADADNQDIYLLDKAGKRVVVTDKKGKYIAQYKNDQIGDATNLVVSEEDKKIILLTNDKLSSIEIKHI